MKFTRSYTKVKGGEPFTVEIEIAIDEIARQLAARAIASKGKESSALRGDIKCKVLRATINNPNLKPQK